jgi:simple sugar transport system permease protein
VSVLGSILSVTMVAQTLRTSVPYVLASQGGVWSERSGVVNVALEGMMLGGGLAGVAVAHASGSAVLGAIGAMVIGAALGALHAFVTERGKIDAIVSGVAINVVALGGTRVVMRALYQSSSNSPSVPGFGEGLAPHGAGILARVLLDPMSLATIACVALTMIVLQSTRFGLRVRACGEGPLAARSAGLAVVRTRVSAVAIGGALAGLGGAALAFDQHQFQSGMSGGRGFMALAAVVLSGWRPGRAATVCLVFAALDALQVVLQGHARAFQDLVQMLPFIAALVALGLLRRGRSGPPAGLGIHAE